MPATFTLNGTICEVPDATLVSRVKYFFTDREAFRSGALHQIIMIPPGATRQGVSAASYHAYRQGLTSACADVVLVAVRDGVPQVPLIRRAQPPFGGCWWVAGGALPNFRSVEQFLLWKSAKEYGLTTDSITDFVSHHELSDSQCSWGDLHLVGCLGVYRTPAEDTTDPQRVCDTINLAYLGLYLGSAPLHYDLDHTALRFATLDRLAHQPCGHWYPEHLARRALGIVNKCVMK